MNFFLRLSRQKEEEILLSRIHPRVARRVNSFIFPHIHPIESYSSNPHERYINFINVPLLKMSF